MMPQSRKSFQGVTNIVRFNWHFYVVAFGAFALLISASYFLPYQFQFYISIIAIAVLLLPVISLAVSWYIYDYSGFYNLKWIEKCKLGPAKSIVNINAGFDETSGFLKQKFPGANVHVLDFYDPEKHTELSIRRARAIYPQYPGTISVATHQLPLATGSSDCIFLIFAAHEIRDENERLLFIAEVRRLLSEKGSVVVVEHLRDTRNFIAFNIGFFHFYSGHSWRRLFNKAGLKITEEAKFTPFVTIFKLKKIDPAA